MSRCRNRFYNGKDNLTIIDIDILIIKRKTVEILKMHYKAKRDKFKQLSDAISNILDGELKIIENLEGGEIIENLKQSLLEEEIYWRYKHIKSYFRNTVQHFIFNVTPLLSIYYFS